MFFGYFSRFIIAWKNAETQNEQRKKKMEAEARKQAAKDNVPEKPAPTEKVRVYKNNNAAILPGEPYFILYFKLLFNFSSFL